MARMYCDRVFEESGKDYGGGEAGDKGLGDER
jgi:hypothetical protein